MLCYIKPFLQQYCSLKPQTFPESTGVAFRHGLRPNNVNVYLLLSPHLETNDTTGPFANLLKPEIETHNGR